MFAIIISSINTHPYCRLKFSSWTCYQPKTYMILSPEGVLYLIGKECSPFRLRCIQLGPENVYNSKLLINNIFSIVLNLTRWYMQLFSAISYIQHKLNYPNSRLASRRGAFKNSTGALCFRKSLYFKATLLSFGITLLSTVKIESSLHTLVSRVPLSSSLSSGLNSNGLTDHGRHHMNPSLLLPNNSIRVYMLGLGQDCILSCSFVIHQYIVA